ncbi:MAG: HIT family protein [Parvularculaceae bacterium]|nr:HIT family protein [Parvularculaceae bacterium]
MSLQATYDPGNIFARILRGELPAVKVYEDDAVIAFMDIFPQSRGHLLVIPKRSSAVNLLDESPSTLEALIVRVQCIARAVVTALEPDGVRIAQFNGAPAGQTVFHLHFHVIPIYDDLKLAPHAAGKADMAELEATAAKIRHALS